MAIQLAALALALTAPTGAILVPKHATLELCFTAARAIEDPFDTYLLKLEVTDPSGRVFTVDGFFDGDGNGGQSGRVWKARLCPGKPGVWSWRTVEGDAPDVSLSGLNGRFQCLDSEDPGGLTRDGRHFRFQDGGAVYLVGTFLDTNDLLRGIYLSPTATAAERESCLARHRDFHGANKLGFHLSNRTDFSGRGGLEVTNPWVGDPDSPDPRSMDLSRWKRFDEHLLRLKENGMFAELWLFEDGKRAPGMGSYAYLPMPARLRLARYTMARTSALSHMMYLIGWEWQEAWSRAEVDQLGASVSAHNPWGRLVSVHNLDLASNGEVLWPLSGSPWASFAATQSGTSSPSAANHCALSMLKEPIPYLEEEFKQFTGDSDPAIRGCMWACFTGGSAGAGTGSDLKALQGFLARSRIPFQRMVPSNGLVEGGGDSRFCLAERGHHYLVYSTSGAFTVAIEGSGLSGLWFNPRDADAPWGTAFAVTPGKRSFVPPDAAVDWVLWITDGADLNSGRTHPSTNATLVRAAVPPAATPVAFEEPPPREWTAKEDHQDMLDQLGIKTLRRGADGMNRSSPSYQNTDESKANPWPDLPDPLRLKNGERVTTAEAWWKRRRPEIVEEFDREVYGRVPRDAPKVVWSVTSSKEEKRGDIPVVTKTLVGRADNSSCPSITVDIQLTLTTPAGAAGPVPVMMEFGFNFGRFDGGGIGGPGIPGRKGAAPPGGGAPGWQEQVLGKGWGFAIITPTSVQADSGSGLRKGIIGLSNKGRPRKPDDWGALRAWAWGASRALDYLETDKAVDARQVGIEGLSRYGKAALVAMAYDERFAIGFIGSSGEGGAKLHRRNWGELVENLTGSGEYHWMAGNFLKYGGPLNAGDLPVDSHELIALCAPRPVFISYGASSGPGAEGTWVDQKGSFMAAVAAGPVFRLLGKKDLGTTEFPPVETALIDGELAFRQHAGGHSTGPNWPTFLQFAGRYVKGPAVPAREPPAGKKE